MITSQIFDHAARLRSFELLATCYLRDATDGAARESEDQAATSLA